MAFTDHILEVIWFTVYRVNLTSICVNVLISKYLNMQIRGLNWELYSKGKGDSYTYTG